MAAAEAEATAVGLEASAVAALEVLAAVIAAAAAPGEIFKGVENG